LTGRSDFSSFNAFSNGCSVAAIWKIVAEWKLSLRRSPETPLRPNADYVEMRRKPGSVMGQMAMDFPFCQRMTRW
jgi:hypothetical protein